MRGMALEGAKTMLILTRRTGETIMIGNDCTVTVLGVKGNQVRVGVNAPKEVPVHREEIYERIQHEQQEAAASLSRQQAANTQTPSAPRASRAQ